MLQQTRVDTVIPYFERFMARFPSPHALAEADEDAVLAAWSGLGYYRRARFLHAGAREVVEKYGGQVPASAAARRGLPGVGRYTAGAIGSIAFDQPEPIVDGNVARVVCRQVGIDTPLGRADTERSLWEQAEQWVAGPRPGDFNQALMELGATVCTPAAPRCDACPVRDGCVAHASGRTAELPVPKVRKPPTAVRVSAVVATTPDPWRVWLVRGDTELFGGLWGTPMRKGRGRRAACAALADAGLAGRVGARAIDRIVHVLSHRRLEVDVFAATLLPPANAAPPVEPRARAFDRDTLETVGISALTRKILAHGPVGQN
jgi:A/G-specific adenine glycosylase